MKEKFRVKQYDQKIWTDMKSQKKAAVSDKGEIVLYQTPGGKTALNVRFFQFYSIPSVA